MGEQLSKLFVPLTSLPGLYDLPEECVEPMFHPEDHLRPTFGGVVQLLFLAAVYGAVLFTASNMIADGSELLLLIPELAPVVGSVVLPVLGAVPDGAIVLFSGLGDKEKAQEQLSVGVGALAGSTIMLLTLPWTLSVFAGRVNIENGHCVYKRPAGAGRDWKKLDPNRKNWIVSTGVEPNSAAMKSSALTMAVTSISYLVIQGAAFAYHGEAESKIAADEKNFALFGLIMCTISFFAYLIHQVRHSKEDKVLQDVVDDKRTQAMKKGILSLQGAFYHALNGEMNDSSSTSLLGTEQKQARFAHIVRKFFNQYDVDGDGRIDRRELKLLLQDLHIPNSDEHTDHYMKQMDIDQSGDIEFSEFVACMARIVSGDYPPESETVHHQQQTSYGTTDRHLGTLMQHAETNRGAPNAIPSESQARMEHAPSSDTMSGFEDEEEEEDVPEDLADLPPDVQRRRILFRAFSTMGIGTCLVLLLSDPMVDVLSEVGNVIGVPPFYVSFVLAPLASNASELLASYGYALKKTSKTITISLTALQGAAIMNNTFCLGIFLALVYFRELEWSFSAETISIIFVQAVMIWVSLHHIQTIRLSFLVAALFPLSILLVAVLENVFGLD